MSITIRAGGERRQIRMHAVCLVSAPVGHIPLLNQPIVEFWARVGDIRFNCASLIRNHLGELLARCNDDQRPPHWRQ